MRINTGILFILFFFPISILFGQSNFIIDKNISYEKFRDINDTTKCIVSYDDAVIHEDFGNIPVLLIKIPLKKRIDSLELHIFNNKVTFKDYFPLNTDIEKLPVYSYEIQQSRGNYFAMIYFNPFVESKQNRCNGYNQVKLLITTYASDNNDNKRKKTWESNSVLSSGDWYKIKLNKTGIYKLTGAQLANMGVSLNNLNTNDIRLYGNGGGMLPEINLNTIVDDLQENAIQIVDINSNGKFENEDYILFYGKGPNNWIYNGSIATFKHSQHLYDDYAYYFITINAGNSKRITTLSQSINPANHSVNKFIDFQYYDRDSVNLIKSGKQWFGDEFNIILSHQYSFNFPNLVLTDPVKINVSVAARSTSLSQMNIIANGTSKTISIPYISGAYNSSFAYDVYQSFTINSSSPLINITANYIKSTSNSIGWMDYIEVTGNRSLHMVGNQMSFRNTDCVGNGNISDFILQNASSDIKIWDVTNSINPYNMDYNFNSGVIDFRQKTDSLREFIAFNGGYLTPAFVEKVDNQNLHAAGQVDYVICYNEKFKDQAEELAHYHRTTNKLSVYTVNQKLVFNEFSSGAADIAALRNFMRMLYDKANSNGTSPPKYLLLFGDASYDYKNRIDKNSNYILTFESIPSLNPISSYSSDDFFGLLDENEGYECSGSLDIGIGRFPISTIAEAESCINKVKRYQATHNQPTGDINQSSTTISNMADWRNIVCFIGDDQDNNIHVTQSDYMAEYVRLNFPRYNIDKIYLDAYVQQTTPGGQRYPDAKRDLNLRVGNGALLLNYTGHGGEIGLAHESLLEINDIQSWNNMNNMPLFITATCEFSRYDDPARVSAGEYAYSQNQGGMIGLLTTSRLTFSGSNFTLNKYIIENTFKKTNGKYPSLGEIIRASKVSAGSITNNRNFVLLGDPALRLAYPEYDITTTTINGKPIQQFNDTLKALSFVTIEGQVEAGGQVMTQFNGYIYPTIFDKTQNYSTLGQDYDSSPYSFILQKNILYKGKATVKNGLFSFSFLIPKDINYSIGMGKISYYAENGKIDASGYFDSLLVGASSLSGIIDNVGPKIKLFMNDTLFDNGGLTDENPVLLAFLSDSNGINTTGNGIGHDITLILDNNSSNSLTLNNYYKSKINSYQDGFVIYPLRDIAEGEHIINLKAWDVLNNSNTESLRFIVARSESTMITSIMNYPNPFTDFTSFVFEHNMAGRKLDISIEIFDMQGTNVRTLKTTFVNSGYKVESNNLKWSGTGEYGQKLYSGVYTYRVIVSSDAGETASKGGKLVLIN